MSIIEDIELLEERVDELELLLLEESLERDELAEEVELLREELENRPKVIIKEIHHHHTFTPQWNYYPPIQVQPFFSPLTGPQCGTTDGKYLC